MAEKHGTENSLCFQHLLIFIACFGTSLAAGRLCKFAEKFPGVGGSCYKESTDVSSGSGSSNGGTSVPVDPISYPTTAEESEVSTNNDVFSGSGSGNGGTWLPVDTISYPTTAEELEVSTTNDVTSELGLSNEGTSLPVDATSYTTIRTNCLTSNGSVIQNGSLLVNEDCTRISTCDNGIMNYNDLYQCSSDAVCEVRNDVRKCYCMSGYHGNGVNCAKHMADCKDWYDAGNTTNGIYTIKPTNWSGASFDVSCNMTDGGGWTVFQRRVDGSVDFNRTWISYKGGFGDVSHEFWLGNDKLYHLTNQGNYQLRIDFVSRDGDPFYAKFDRFRINNESDNYRLSKIGEYSGNAGGCGSFGSRLNYSFSTSDKNNGGCSDDYHCGWWFRECQIRCLNGDYHAALNAREDVHKLSLRSCQQTKSITALQEDRQKVERDRDRLIKLVRGALQDNRT